MDDQGACLRRRLGLVTQEEFAATLGVSVETVSEWRRLKRGPDFVKTGKGVMYREIDIQEWLSVNVVPVMRRTG